MRLLWTMEAGQWWGQVALLIKIFLPMCAENVKGPQHSPPGSL